MFSLTCLSYSSGTFGPNTITPTSSKSASGTAVVACCGGVMSTVRTVSLTQPNSAASAVTRQRRRAPDRGPDPETRLLAGFVATVFLPEFFLERRIRFVHRGFAQLTRH